MTFCQGPELGNFKWQHRPRSYMRNFCEVLFTFEGQNLSTRNMFICDLNFCVIAEIFKCLKRSKDAIEYGWSWQIFQNFA